MRLIVVVGARPNVVKIGPLLPEMRRAGISVDLAFTGSRSVDHPEDERGAVSFFGVNLPNPAWFLDIGLGSDAATTGRAMVVFEDLFAAERPDAVMVIGESNSTLAAAISAAKAGLAVVHLDAGLRCGDLQVPEEINRVLISRIASVHLTPTEGALENLEDEGIEPERIYFVGSSLAESVLRHVDDIVRLRACADYGLEPRGYVLASFHRDENLTDPRSLVGIIGGLALSPLPVLLPDTDGLGRSLEALSSALPPTIMLVEAVPYSEMLALERDAAAVITDSGGVQVEACMVGVPCLTVRDCTEMVPTVEIGANRLVSADAQSIHAALLEAMGGTHSWVEPKRWDRAVSDRVARALKRRITPLA